MLLMMIRHGETTDNLAHRMSGQLDVTLTDKGVRQAQAVARYLQQAVSLDYLYCSDLQRAHATAAAIEAGQNVASAVRQAWLRERNAGVLQGLTKTQMKRDHKQTHLRWKSDDDDAVIDEGETRRGFRTRVHEGMHALTQQHAGDTVALVTHTGVLREAFNYVFDSTETGNALRCKNASISQFRFEKGLWSMERWGDTSYVESRFKKVDSPVVD